MLPRAYRLRDRQLAEKIAQSGRIVETNLFRVRVRFSAPTQFRVVVSKKIAKRAVERNKFRRRIYEALRDALPQLTEPVQAIIFAKANIRDARWNEITLAVKTALTR